MTSCSNRTFELHGWPCHNSHWVLPSSTVLDYGGVSHFSFNTDGVWCMLFVGTTDDIFSFQIFFLLEMCREKPNNVLVSFFWKQVYMSPTSTHFWSLLKGKAHLFLFCDILSKVPNMNSQSCIKNHNSCFACCAWKFSDSCKKMTRRIWTNALRLFRMLRSPLIVFTNPFASQLSKVHVQTLPPLIFLPSSYLRSHCQSFWFLRLAMGELLENLDRSVLSGSSNLWELWMLEVPRVYSQESRHQLTQDQILSFPLQVSIIMEVKTIQARGVYTLYTGNCHITKDLCMRMISIHTWNPSWKENSNLG